MSYETLAPSRTQPLLEELEPRILLSAINESEPNNELYQADEMSFTISGDNASAWAYGNNSSTSDYDLFTFTTPKFFGGGSRIAQIVMRPTSSDHKLDALLKFANGAGTVLKTANDRGDNGVEVIDINLESNSRYYINCTNADIVSIGSGDYSLEVYILDYDPVVSVSISGPTTVDEGSAAQYVATATCANGNTGTVSNGWAWSGAIDNITSAGYLTAGNVTKDTTSTIYFSYGSGVPNTSYSITVKNINHRPDRPECLSPAFDMTIDDLRPTLEASSFSDPDGDSHRDSVFQIATDRDFNNVVWQWNDDDSDKTSERVPSGVLSYSTQYYWTVTYRDDQGMYSLKAVPAPFETPPAPPVDTTAPTPNPSEWKDEPYSTGTTSIKMEATMANDPSGVEYYFDCPTNGAFDSGWQDSPIYEATGLSPNTTYTFRFKTRDKSSNHNAGDPSPSKSATTNQTSDTTAPGNISSFTATGGDGQVSLSWSNPSDSDFAGVRIQRKTGSYPTSYTDGTTIYNDDGTSFTDTGLTNGTTYYYKAFSYDEVPNYSSGSSAGATLNQEGRTYIVNSLMDNVTADGMVTLREAIQAANTNIQVGDAPGGSTFMPDIIVFDTLLAGGTITLNGTVLTISDDLEIHGLGADQLTIDANDQSQVFTVNSGVSALFNGFLITGGNLFDLGGGICNYGDLMLTNMMITGNTAKYGGGIFNSEDATIVMTNSTVSKNSAISRGGGICSWGNVTLTNTVILGNTTISQGGGIFTLHDTILALTNTVVSSNSAEYGGGIYNWGTTTLVNTTVSGNSAADKGAGGIFNTSDSTLVMSNTIVALNDATGNAGEISGNNYAGKGNLIGVDPSFLRNPSDGGDGWGDNPDTAGVDEGANDDYGDLRLSASSAAVDFVGNVSLLPNDTVDLDGDDNASEPIPLDLAGNPRVVGGVVDVGAYEYQGAATPGREAQSLEVSSMADIVDIYDGTVTLREAILYAGLVSTGREITFAPSLFASGAATITLSGTPLLITDEMQVVGPGSSLLTVDGDRRSRVIGVFCDGEVSIGGMRLLGGACYDQCYGGGIINDGNLALTDITISDNWADWAGGGIYNSPESMLTLTNSTISGNSTDSCGGGIYNLGDITLNNTMVLNNCADWSGGGISSSMDGTLTLINSTVSGNSALDGSGGGILDSTGILTIINSAILDNFASDEGGGIYNWDNLTLTNITVSGNIASSGGGIYQIRGPLALTNSVVAANSASSEEDIHGEYNSVNSFVGTVDGDPMLTAVSDTYGTILCCIPRPDSPLVDTGNNTFAVGLDGTPLTTDQRGRTRIVNGTVDIGAVELPAEPELPTLTTSPSALHYTENSGQIKIDLGLIISDPLNRILTEARVWISDNYVGAEDILGGGASTWSSTYEPGGSIQANFDSQTGILTLSRSYGQTDASAFQESLRRVYYSNNSNSPSVLSRTISFAVFDGEQWSETVTRVVNIETVNDRPTVQWQALDVELGRSVVVNLAGEDVETDYNDLIFNITNGPEHGTLENIGQGQYRYTPNADFAGEDSFTYTVTDTGDPAGTPGNVLTSLPATITLNTGYEVQLDARGRYQYTDADGDRITVRLTGPGTGTLYFAHEGNSDLTRLELDGTTGRSKLTISGRRATTTIDDIIVEGSLNSLTGTIVDLGGDITISGTINTLRLRNVADDHHIVIGPAANNRQAVAMTFGMVQDLIIDSATPIRSLKVTEWLDTDGSEADAVNAPWIGTLKVTGNKKVATVNGDFQADLNLTGVGAKRYALTTAYIAGDLKNADWDIIGQVNSIQAKGKIDNLTLDGGVGQLTYLRSLSLGDVQSASVVVAGNIGSVSAIQWLAGTVEAQTIQTLKTTGRRVKGWGSELAGDFQATVTLSGSTNPKLWSVKSAYIAGDLNSSQWNVTGRVNKFQVRGTAQGSRLQTTGDIRSLLLGASYNSNYLAGVDKSFQGVFSEDRNDFVNESAKIWLIRILGLRGTAKETRYITDTHFTAGRIGGSNLLNADLGSVGFHVLDREGNISYIRHTDKGDKTNSWYWKPGKPLGNNSLVNVVA